MRKKASDYDQEVLDLYNEYVHSKINRREFINRASKFAVGGMTAVALLESLSPQYALAQQIAPDDPRITTEYIEYPSPDGHGTVRGLISMPANHSGKIPAVVVVHENRGLNPYIEDVTRRLAVEGFLALGPDGLTPAGGYPGNDDDGREMQAKLDADKLREDFVAAAEYLRTHPHSTGKVGVVGFCYGGGISNMLSVRLPWLAAAVPFYGRQADVEDVPKINAPLLFQFAENDDSINASWPAYEAALKQHGKDYTAYIYPGTNHGFHNDTTPRYDEAAAKLAWTRTVAFFKQHLML